MNPNDIPRNLIDVEKVIADKNPALLKVIPGFIIRYLKKILHQDAVNGYIYRNREKFGLPFVEAILNEFGVKVSSTGLHAASHGAVPKPITHIAHRPSPIAHPTSPIPHPTSQNAHRYIIAANHPLGGLDGMALMHAVGQVFPDVVFPVNDILMNIPGLQPLFIPINKHGSNAENIRLIDETFASDKTILYFPAGLVSRKFRGGVIEDLEWKKTFITKARRYQRDIIPTFIDGKNSDFFYNLARWRKRLHIGANLEMLYLVDEMMRQKGNTIHITFGEPVPWTTFDRSKPDAAWAKMVRDKVYALGAAG